MVKSAKANDLWKKVYGYSQDGKFINYIKELEISDYKGKSSIIKLCPGITIICGLNGAGKSSIIASIKTVLGLTDQSIVSKNKLCGEICAQMILDGKEIQITPDSSAIDNGLDNTLVQYIDSDQALNCLKTWEQTHLDELLEGEEDNPFKEDQIRDLSWLVGKQYTECTSIELSTDAVYSTGDIGSNFIPVYFKVTKDDVSYTSTEMGLGEHFTIYMYYAINRLPDNSILIIEEPESNISVLTQHNLMNYLAQIIVKKHISVIISSHSPHITNLIKNEHILIVANSKGNLHFYTPQSIVDANTHLGIKYQSNCSLLATIYVEDEIARLFLTALLDEELPTLSKLVDIISVGGDSHITERLAFSPAKYMKHKQLGVYDADLKEAFDASSLKCPYTFLPIKDCVEKEILSFLQKEGNIESICQYLNIDLSVFWIAFEKNQSEEHHDFFLNICRDLHIDKSTFVCAFYSIWKTKHKKELQQFSKQICSFIIEKEEDLSPRDLFVATL